MPNFMTEDFVVALKKTGKFWKFYFFLSNEEVTTRKLVTPNNFSYN